MAKTLKRPKRVEDSSVFDDFWTEWIVMTWTFILDILCFFCFVSICGVGCGQLGLYATSQNIVKMHVLCPIISFRFSVFFFSQEEFEHIRTHPNASENFVNFRKLPKTSEDFWKLRENFINNSRNFRKRFGFFFADTGSCGCCRGYGSSHSKPVLGVRSSSYNLRHQILQLLRNVTPDID